MQYVENANMSFFFSGTVKTGNFQSTRDLNSSLGKKNIQI